MKYRWCNKQNVNPTDKQHTFPYEFKSVQATRVLEPYFLKPNFHVKIVPIRATLR